jgi:CubicO group peptidase (beta-lactamase class C family)
MEKITARNSFAGCSIATSIKRLPNAGIQPPSLPNNQPRFMNHSYLLLISLIFAVSCTKNNANTPEPVSSGSYFPPTKTTEWATTTPESLGWTTSQIQPLYDYLQSTNSRAFIVLKDGKIVLEKYFGQTIANTGPFNQNSSWYWASAGKTLTGFMVGKAQEEKLLSIDQRTTQYLGAGWTSLPAAKENLITIKHQLTMTTGLDDGVVNNDNTSPVNLVYKADAGTRWAYHNAPYTLLEKVVSKAINQPFDPYFDTRLKNKIGMDGQWIWSGDNHVFYSTARSMARFGLLMANKAIWDGQPILNDDAFLTASTTSSQTLNNSYGYLWWLNGKASFMIPTLQTIFPGSLTPNAPADMVAAMGRNGQLINIVPSKNLVVIRMGDAPDGAALPMTFQNEIWKRLNLVIK